MNTQKGFTLLELLIVIGILAVLASASMYVLNPAELMRESRDSTRISDLSALQSALSLYVASASSPDMDGSTSSCSTLCYAQPASVAANCDSRHSGKTTTIDSTREVDSNGWLPVDLTGIPGGSPLAVLPIDPTAATATAPYLFYSYACDNTNKTFELNCVFESTKYLTTNDYDGNDGGDSTDFYEVGTEPGLDI